MKSILLLLLCAATFTTRAQLLIRNISVADVEKKRMLPPQHVLIEHGIITAMGTRVSATAGTPEIDGTGKWLIPGLVDAHIHFFQSGGIYARPDAVDLRADRPYAEEIDWTHANMERFLRGYAAAGITSVVDVGATVSFLKQRDSFRTKPYAPSVYMTGPLLTTWEPPVYKGLKEDEPFLEMKTPDDARAFVQQQLPYRPDFIKIWYIARGRNTDSAARAGLPLVQAAIEEAHKNGLRVAVHATERITAQLAVEAGADLLVHGVDDEPVEAAFIKLLRDKKVVLSPTLVVSDGYRRALGQTYALTPDAVRYALPATVNSILDFAHLQDSALRQRYQSNVRRTAAGAKRTDSLLRLNLKRLHEGGVLIATGTDAGNIGTQHIASYWDEVAAMGASGMSTWDLLQASTLNGARAVGKEAEFGSVAKGRRADLLVLTQNPAEGPANWKSVEWVIQRGTAFRPDSLVRPTPEELADRQLLAYNAHHLEAFLQPYSEEVEIYDLSTGKLQVKGKDAMRKRYEFLNGSGKRHCRLLNRIVQGNVVIDHEEILTDRGTFHAVAIYETAEGKIAKVWFAR